MLGKHKLNAQALISLSVLVLIGLAIAGYVLFSTSSTPAKHSYSSELVFADANKGEVALTDQTGKQVSKATYPKFSYLNFQAVAPNGGVLASINTGGNSESFIFTRANALKSFTGDSAKLLSSAALVQSSHQIFFIDEKSVVLLSCPDPSATCVLQDLNLSTDTSSKILDTGAKQANAYIPSVYLAGYSLDKHLAYVRVINAKNNMSSLTNAIYEIDINSSKVMRSLDMSSTANFTTALSPDGSKLAYTQNDSKNNLTVCVLDLSSEKTQKIAWNKGPLFTGPGTLKWSSDGTKLLVQTTNITIAADGKPQTPTVIAYIDLANNNQIHVIQQIKDPSFETVYSLGWLSNDQIAYQIKKSTTANSLLGATNQTLKQNISGSPASALQVPTGDLAQVALY